MAMVDSKPTVPIDESNTVEKSEVNTRPVNFKLPRYFESTAVQPKNVVGGEFPAYTDADRDYISKAFDNTSFIGM